MHCLDIFSLVGQASRPTLFFVAQGDRGHQAQGLFMDKEDVFPCRQVKLKTHTKLRYGVVLSNALQGVVSTSMACKAARKQARLPSRRLRYPTHSDPVSSPEFRT